jgi:hypothetical protein
VSGPQAGCRAMLDEKLTSWLGKDPDRNGRVCSTPVPELTASVRAPTIEAVGRFGAHVLGACRDDRRGDTDGNRHE